MYEEEIQFLDKVEDKNEIGGRIKYSNTDIEKLIEDYPMLPIEYQRYLTEIGYGVIRECQFALYSGLVKIEAVLDEHSLNKANIDMNKYLIFGDNMSGDISGFDTSAGWAIIEYIHDEHRIAKRVASFKQYIRSKMLLDSDGADLRNSV